MFHSKSGCLDIICSKTLTLYDLLKQTKEKNKSIDFDKLKVDQINDNLLIHQAVTVILVTIWLTDWELWNVCTKMFTDFLVVDFRWSLFFKFIHKIFYRYFEIVGYQHIWVHHLLQQKRKKTSCFTFASWIGTPVLAQTRKPKLNWYIASIWI